MSTINCSFEPDLWANGTVRRGFAMDSLTATALTSSDNHQRSDV